MEENEVMNLLRYYRHDIMNDLQIVQAYTSMGKFEKVEDKLATCMSRFNEERKLMELNAPSFALWLIPFNSIHPNFRFTYTIHAEKIDLSNIDVELRKQSQNCIERLEEKSDEKELYEGEIILDYVSEKGHVQVQFALKDPTGFNTNALTSTVTIPWDRKGEE